MSFAVAAVDGGYLSYCCSDYCLATVYERVDWESLSYCEYPEGKQVVLIINYIFSSVERKKSSIDVTLTWACVKLWWIAESDEVRRQLESGGLR